MLSPRPSVRVGFGYDVHRLTPGRPLILGGVHIPHDQGLVGHSDADVLLHALADALLGAAALGDIGLHFPDTDPALKGLDSMQLLRGVVVKIHEAGYQVGNVDLTLVLEKPKIRPYVDRMRDNIARVLGVALDGVSIKATTSEKLGFVGNEEGAVAYAVCMLEARMVG